MHESALQAPLLQPPKSVVGVLGFLSRLASARRINRETVGSILDREPITCSDARAFLGWLHVDRFSMPLREYKSPPLEKNLRLAEKPEPSEEKVIQLLERDGGQIDLHIWEAPRPLGTMPRRPRARPAPTGVERGRPQSRESVPFEAYFWADGREQIDQRTERVEVARLMPVIIQDSVYLGEGGAAPGPPGIPGYGGRQAYLWSQSLASDRQISGVLWNEPVRKDILGLLTQPAQPPAIEPAQAQPVESDALYGQVTLIAPPITVAPDRPESRAGVSFDWRDVATGVGPVDESSFMTLATSMPPGSKALYPAMDPRSLTRGAVNLRLAPSMIQTLVGMGFGESRRVDAFGSARKVDDYYGGSPPVRRMPSQIVPVESSRRPASPTSGQPSGPARRMRFLDYLGFPIYLSPTLSVQPDLDQQTYANVTTTFLPRAPLMSALSFAGLRQRLFSGFTGLEAKPDPLAWRTAQPSVVRSIPAPKSPGQTSTPSFSGRSLPQQMPTQPQTPLRPQATSLPGAVPSRPATRAYDPRVAATTPSPTAVSAPTLGSPPAGGLPPSQTPVSGPPTRSSAAGSTLASLPPIPSPVGLAGIPTGVPQAPVPPIARLSVNPILTPAAKPTAPGTPRAKLSAAAPKPTTSPRLVAASGPAAAPATAIPALPYPVPGSTSHGQPASLPDRHLPTMQTVRPPDLSPTHSSSTRSPQMVVGPRPAVRPESPAEALAVQTAAPESAATPSAPSGHERAPHAGERKEAGMPGSEINLLANEVWSLLKRRLAFEAQRTGRR